MRTALDAPASRLDEEERWFVDRIREFGWVSTHVREEAGASGFTYTTGFRVTLGQPELILFSLNRRVAHDIFRDIFDDLKQGVRLPVAEAVPDVLGNADAFLLPVARKHYTEHLGWSRWFYGGDDFECLQLVWPDRQGRFPWQTGFEATMADCQPDRSQDGWNRWKGPA